MKGLQLNKNSGDGMRQKLTDELIQGMITKSMETFYLSNRPQFEKDKLGLIAPCVHFNSRIKVLGRAYLCHTRDPFTKKHELRSNYDPVLVEGRKSFFVMDLNTDLQRYPRYEVCDTVSHELAHLLDFCYNGYYNRAKPYHCARWQELHIAMGGTGHLCASPQEGSKKNGENKKAGPTRS